MATRKGLAKASSCPREARREDPVVVANQVVVAVANEVAVASRVGRYASAPSFSTMPSSCSARWPQV